MIDISVRDLTKAFEVNNNILDGLTFQVQHGERVGILGRNGTGKTTLFRLMVGELTEDKGEIDIARGKRLGLVSQILPGGLHRGGRACHSGRAAQRDAGADAKA